MIRELFPVFAQAQFSSSQQMSLLVVAMAFCVPAIIAVVGICAGAWTKVHKLRLEHSLKQQMIDRGMPAEEIVAVLQSRGRYVDAVESPVASEVVVQNDDEWQTGLILRREGERYYVHLVGTDMSENQWVTADRVRFPAGIDDRYDSARDWSFGGGAVRVNPFCTRPGSSKPAPVDQEI
jgi:hypothetical protein